MVHIDEILRNFALSRYVFGMVKTGHLPFAADAQRYIEELLCRKNMLARCAVT